MFIKKGDMVKHSILGTGKIEKIDSDMMYVKFDSKDEISKFLLSDFSNNFKKYFKEENVFKEYNHLTKTWLNEDGYYREGFRKQGIRTRDRYSLNEFYIDGYDRNGFDKNGVHYFQKHPIVIYEMVIDNIKGKINKNSFIDALIRVGRQTTDQIIKEELRELYKKLVSIPNFWEQTVKKKIVNKKGWDLFSSYERTDRPPPYIQNKKRSATCYKCNGSLYSDIHQRCPKCKWLICPYDNSCGCGFEYKFARNDFMY